MKYFSNDPNGATLNYHLSTAEAQEAARQAFQAECDLDELPENVTEICHGIVLGRVTSIDDTFDLREEAVSPAHAVFPKSIAAIFENWTKGMTTPETAMELVGYELRQLQLSEAPTDA